MRKKNNPSEIDLIPSLREVVESEHLDAEKLSVALEADEEGKILFKDRHLIFVSDGRNAGAWNVPSLRALFRGSKAPPDNLETYPPEYAPLFFTVEKHILAVSSPQRAATDQEMESVYSAIRRRPDGKNLLGPTHDILWQAVALMLGMYVVSEAEFLALMNRLERSARLWALKPVSRNYAKYLRESFASLDDGF